MFSIPPAKRAKVSLVSSDDKSEIISATEDKKVTLVSSDGKTFKIDMSFATRSNGINHHITRIAGNPSEGNIVIHLPQRQERCKRYPDGTFNNPLPRATAKVLDLMLSYHYKFAEAQEINSSFNEEDLKRMDVEFAEFTKFHKVDLTTLAQITRAASRFNMWNLNILACRALKALTIARGLTVEKKFSHTFLLVKVQEKFRFECGWSDLGWGLLNTLKLLLW